jgi:hypothetical protein
MTFMGGLFALDTLVGRLKSYAERLELRPGAFFLLEQTLQRGEMPRGDAARVTGLKERSARDLLGTLVEGGILASDTRCRCASRWMRRRCSSRRCFPRLRRSGTAASEVEPDAEQKARIDAAEIAPGRHKW